MSLFIKKRYFSILLNIFQKKETMSSNKIHDFHISPVIDKIIIKDDLDAFIAYFESEGKYINLFKQFCNKIITNSEYSEMYYYAVSWNSLRIVTYMISNKIVDVNNKLDSANLLKLASNHDEMYNLLLEKGLCVDFYMYQQEFLVNTIMKDNLSLYKAYLDRADVYLLQAKLDRKIVKNGKLYHGDSIVDILVKLDNPSMNEYMLKWCEKKLKGNTVKSKEKQKIMEIMFFTLAGDDDRRAHCNGCRS